MRCMTSTHACPKLRPKLRVQNFLSTCLSQTPEVVRVVGKSAELRGRALSAARFSCVTSRRCDIVDAGNPGVYHCVSRCVRRESLLEDPSRREWIVNRLQFLTDFMAVDVISFAVMRNHIHLLLAIRPDVVSGWSDAEVAERRVRLMPNLRWRRKHQVPDGAAPTEDELAHILRSPSRLAKTRTDLCNLGFFHRLLKEPCARAWNRAEGVTGHFWEGRFKSPRVLDLKALEDVARYVELNEIHAGAAVSIAASAWTSGSLQIGRLVGLLHQVVTESPGLSPQIVLEALRSYQWLPAFACRPTSIMHCDNPIVGAPDPIPSVDAGLSGTTANLRLVDHLEGLHAAGMQERRDKRGRIPRSEEPPLLFAFREVFGSSLLATLNQRLGLTEHTKPLDSFEVSGVASRIDKPDDLCPTAVDSAAGSHSDRPPPRGTCYGGREAVVAEAARRGRRWVCGRRIEIPRPAA
jgi:Transposase IS200 like